MYSKYSCEITSGKNNLLDDEMKVKIRIPVWPSQIPDLSKLLFGLWVIRQHLHIDKIHTKKK